MPPKYQIDLDIELYSYKLWYKNSFKQKDPLIPSEHPLRARTATKNLGSWRQTVEMAVTSRVGRFFRSKKTTSGKKLGIPCFTQEKSGFPWFLEAFTGLYFQPYCFTNLKNCRGDLKFDAFIPTFLYQALLGKMISRFGKGHNTNQFCCSWWSYSWFFRIFLFLEGSWRV